MTKYLPLDAACDQMGKRAIHDALPPVLTSGKCLNFIFRHSLVDCGSSQLYLSVCVCVCPAFTAYISDTMGWILIKLGGNVGT